MITAAEEAMRITYQIEAFFATGAPKRGTAFLSPVQGELVTCAHVIVNDQGQSAKYITVKTATGAAAGTASVSKVSNPHDLAFIRLPGMIDSPCKVRVDIPKIGEQLIFAGHPAGVARPSVFPGMVSAVGKGLISSPTCEMIQLAGMVNNGNSGGPLLDSSGNVVGVISAKYVPLLLQIDKLIQALSKFQPVGGGIVLNGLDFGPFSTATVQNINQIAQVLRLVQVGVGWAVPAKFF